MKNVNFCRSGRNHPPLQVLPVRHSRACPPAGTTPGSCCAGATQDGVPVISPGKPDGIRTVKGIPGTGGVDSLHRKCCQVTRLPAPLPDQPVFSQGDDYRRYPFRQGLQGLSRVISPQPLTGQLLRANQRIDPKHQVFSTRMQGTGIDYGGNLLQAGLFEQGG